MKDENDARNGSLILASLLLIVIGYMNYLICVCPFAEV